MSVPNIITGIRFLLVPFFPIIYFGGFENSRLAASLIFISAMFLDVLDGFIARKFNMITKFGQVFDPVADKAMSITVVSTLAWSGKISCSFLWFLLIKEAAMIIGGAVIYKNDKVVIPSNFFGKAATILIFLLLLDAMYLQLYVDIFSIITAISMILALITYCLSFANIKLKKNSNNEVVK